MKEVKVRKMKKNMLEIMLLFVLSKIEQFSPRTNIMLIVIMQQHLILTTILFQHQNIKNYFVMICHTNFRCGNDDDEDISQH